MHRALKYQTRKTKLRTVTHNSRAFMTDNCRGLAPATHSLQQASKRERWELENTARIQYGQPLLPNISSALPRASPYQLSSPIVRDTSNQPVVQPILQGHPPLQAKPADTSHDDEDRLQAGEVIILDLGSTPTLRDPQYIQAP
jgi:hypothetical protein